MEFSKGITLLWILVAVVVVVATESKDHTQVTKTERKLVEHNSPEHRNALDNSTERPDPLDKLRKYKGGYDITNKHYWSSLIFTGIYGYSIAALWLLIGMVYVGLLAIARARSSYKRKDGKWLTCRRRRWPMMAATFFAVLVMVASGVVLAGNSKFHSRVNSIKRIITDTGKDASTTIYNVTIAVKNIQANSESYRGIGISIHLNSTAQKLNNEASKIKNKTREYDRLISKGLKILKETTIVIVSLTMVGVLPLIVAGLLMLRCPLNMFLTLCWFLTFFLWLYFGLYFFIDGFAGDTCLALDEYVQYPHNSSLSAVIPCNDKFSANSALNDTKAGIYNLINQVNKNIPVLQSSNLSHKLGLVCNPFSGPPEYRYQPDHCSKDEIKIGDIPRILKGYTCLNKSQEKCGEGIFIPSRLYKTVTNYTTSLQHLLNAIPAMERLVNCQTVKDAFSEILDEQCKPLQKYGHMTWASMVVLSVIMVLLVIVFVVWPCKDYEHLNCHGPVNPTAMVLEQRRDIGDIHGKSSTGIVKTSVERW